MNSRQIRVINIQDMTPVMTEQQIAATHFFDLLDALSIISIETYISAMLILDDQIGNNTTWKKIDANPA